MSSGSLTDRIKGDLIPAMKSGQGLRVSVLRMLLSEMNYKQIEVGRELTDEEVTGVVGREVKKRREAVESFKQGGREEQAAGEAQELEILQEYLPKQLSETELAAEIEQALKGIEVKEFGPVMKVISPLFRGKADGALVAKLVREKLGL